MKNILFIVPSLRRAGAETQIIDLVNTLDASLFNKHLLAFESDLSQLDRVDAANVNFHHVLRRYKYDIGFIKHIAKIIDDHSIDVIHCTMQFSLLIAFLARLRSSRKPKLITVIHTTINRGLKEELQDRLLYSWLLRLCESVIFVCENQKEYWVTKYRFLKDKSIVIYNGVDVVKYDPELYKEKGIEFRSSHHIPDEAFVISCIAGFRPEKGHDHLLRVFHKLPSDAWLILAGDGELREQIEEKIRITGIQDRVILTGNVSEVFQVLSASDITVLSSTAVETFSIAMLESMSMAVPMVASDIGGLSEAIIENETGYLFQSGNEDEMYASIMRVLSDRSETIKMGQCARQLVTRKFSVNVMADETAIMLNKI